ncbi:MAG: N-acetylmuramoyl-L-alanine amidase [Chthoniobacterales bacterium]
MRPMVFAAAAVLVALFLSGCAAPQGVGRFRTVVLDAGHGGIDRGAKGVDGRSVEKTYALDTTKRIERGLRARGFRVVMTRRGDYFVSLPRRVQTSNRERNAVFVSIHYNWAPRRAASGVETFHYNSRSYPLAANIQREINRVAPTPNRGVKRARFHVLRNNTRPAALVELGFMSNSRELQLIKSSSYRQRLADAVVRGVVNSSR